MTLTVRCEAEHICPPSTHSFHPSLTPILLALLPTVPPRPLIPNSLPGCWELDWLPFYCLIFLLQRSSSSRHSSSSSSSSHNFDHHNHQKNDQVFTIGDQFNLNPHLRLIDRGSGNKSPSLASQVNCQLLLLLTPVTIPFPRCAPSMELLDLSSCSLDSIPSLRSNTVNTLNISSNRLSELHTGDDDDGDGEEGDNDGD